VVEQKKLMSMNQCTGSHKNIESPWCPTNMGRD